VELVDIGVFETPVGDALEPCRIRLRLSRCAGRDSGARSAAQPNQLRRVASPARELLTDGVIYQNVRRASGECIACFRPAIVAKVRTGGYFKYRWKGGRVPAIGKLP